MPPPAPYRRNPLDEARARFEGKPSPPRFFPPVGQGRTALGGYISPSAAAKFALEDEEIDYARDRMATQMEGNALSRLQSRSRSRLMPFTEAADIAGEEARKAEYETARRLAPVSERAKEQALLTQADTSEALRGSIPERAELEKLEREKRMDSLLTEDPAEQELRKWTDDPQDLMTYRSLYNRTDPKLSKDERRAAAFKKTLRLSQDRAIISQLREAAALGIEGHDKIDALLEPEIDQEGNYYGDSIKNDPAARRAVQRILATNATQKARMAQEKEDRIADQANRGMILRALLDRKNDYDALVRENPADTEAKARRDEMNAKIDALLADPKDTPPAGSSTQPQQGAAPSVKAGEQDIDAVFGFSKAK